LDNRIRAQETELKDKPALQTTNTTPWAPPTTCIPSTTTGTFPRSMDLSANQRTWRPEKYQTRILKGQSLYCGSFGLVAQVYRNKCPYRWQQHGNVAHVAHFQFNVSTAQIDPVVVNTEAAHAALPSSKSTEN
jgi:hypothetical protein